MSINIQYILNNNIYLKKFLRENSFYYKNLIRNPFFINELNNIMKEKYKLTFPDKLEKLKNDIQMVNSIMDILK